MQKKTVLRKHEKHTQKKSQFPHSSKLTHFTATVCQMSTPILFEDNTFHQF